MMQTGRDGIIRKLERGKGHESQCRRLSGNQLEKLPRNIVIDLSALEEMDLSYNQLQCLPRGILSSNNNLKVLFLSSNKLQRLPKLKNLSEIETLYLENNSLVTLSPDQFQGLSKLKDLAVYENSIQHLPPGVFKGLTNMQSMSFYFNKIRTVSNEQFKDIAPSIRFLTVDTNLMCCHLKKEDADCDFAYVDSFASCERMFKDRAPRICLWVVGIMTLVGAVFVIVWRLVFKETKEKNKIQAIMLINLAWSDGLMGVYLIIIGFDYFGSRQKGHHFYGRSVVCLPLQLSADKPSGWEYSVAMFVGLNFSLVLFVIVAYSMIIFKSCASNRRLAKQGTERERKMKAKQRAADLRREASLAKRVFFIVLTDCVCWLPIVVIGVRSLLEKSFRVRGDLAVWIAVFVLPVNSAINPILYTLSTPQVRGVINAKLRPLWDYLIAKVGLNQNVEAQDQGMEMRVIEEGTHSIHFSTDCNKFENATFGSQKPRTEQNDQRTMSNLCS
ncbi:Relaxin receptor 2 [Stylophora pistillata]|uniref:Relaxin receptor 2 n=1 Tax=Stylophora pistillata TaxID=50429 RepID=A0A2B4R8N2_STYPI|nr:Relaxin receptor 2 [Stylophora pistillata]